MSKPKLRDIIIKKIKDELTNLKTILKGIEKLEIIREQQIKKNRWSSREKRRIKKQKWIGRVRWRFLIVKVRYFERQNNIEENIRLRNTIRKKIDDIDIK